MQVPARNAGVPAWSARLAAVSVASTRNPGLAAVLIRPNSFSSHRTNSSPFIFPRYTFGILFVLSFASSDSPEFHFMRALGSRILVGYAMRNVVLVRLEFLQSDSETLGDATSP